MTLKGITNTKLKENNRGPLYDFLFLDTCFHRFGISLQKKRDYGSSDVHVSHKIVKRVPYICSHVINPKYRELSLGLFRQLLLALVYH